MFLHFLNRELHESLGANPDWETYVRAVRLSSVVHGNVLFCNVSQVYEAASPSPAMVDEIRALSRVDAFVPHSEFERASEFIESRKAMYAHDADRYGMYFKKVPPGFADLPLAKIGPDTATTEFIRGNLLRWGVGEPPPTYRGMICRSCNLLRRRYARL